MNMASMYCCFVDPKGKEMQCQKNEEDRHSIYVRHQLAKGLELKQLTGVYVLGCSRFYTCFLWPYNITKHSIIEEGV